MTDYSTLSDNELLLKLKNNDQKAWRHFYNLYSSMVIGFITRNGGRVADGEDVFHEALAVIRVKAEKGEMKENSNLKNFLITVALNLWRMKCRKKGIEIGDDTAEWANIADADQGIAEETEKRFVLMELYRNELGARCQRLIELRHIEKKSVDEIAESEGLTYDNTKNAIWKCMVELREKVKSALKKVE